MVRVAEGVVERNEPAERAAEDDGVLDSESLAKGDYVVGPSVEIPVARIASVAAPVSTVIVVDDLCDSSQRREEVLLERRVIDTRSTVKHQERRPLAHALSVDHEAGSVDVDVQLQLADRDAHLRDSLFALLESSQSGRTTGDVSRHAVLRACRTRRLHAWLTRDDDG